MGELMEQKSLDVKAAVRIAFDYVRDLFSDNQISDVRLEEVEKTEDDRFWLVTVGFFSAVSDDAKAIPGRLLGSMRTTRTYKLLTIDAQSGAVQSMKIRVP